MTASQCRLKAGTFRATFLKSGLFFKVWQNHTFSTLSPKNPKNESLRGRGQPFMFLSNFASGGWGCPPDPHIGRGELMVILGRCLGAKAQVQGGAISGFDIWPTGLPALPHLKPSGGAFAKKFRIAHPLKAFAAFL